MDATFKIQNKQTFNKTDIKNITIYIEGIETNLKVPSDITNTKFYELILNKQYASECNDISYEEFEIYANDNLIKYDNNLLNIEFLNESNIVIKY